MLRFQSTHLREVRPDIIEVVWKEAIFQSTHLREVRHIKVNKNSVFLRFQSTHLREVRLPQEVQFANIFLISIHAPTWGATIPNLSLPNLSSYFNPRTYVRCDHYIFNSKIRSTNFNPRTYVRCDYHTKQSSVKGWDFNPRTYVRCDKRNI